MGARDNQGALTNKVPVVARYQQRLASVKVGYLASVLLLLRVAVGHGRKISAPSLTGLPVTATVKPDIRGWS